METDEAFALVKVKYNLSLVLKKRAVWSYWQSASWKKCNCNFADWFWEKSDVCFASTAARRGMCLIWDRFICFYAQRLEHVQTLANGYQTTCCQVELLFAVHWKCETFCVAVACSMEWVESCVHECVSCRLIPKIVGTSQWSSVRYDHWWKISCTGADQWMSERWCARQQQCRLTTDKVRQTQYTSNDRVGQ